MKGQGLFYQWSVRVLLLSGAVFLWLGQGASSAQESQQNAKELVLERNEGDVLGSLHQSILSLADPFISQLPKVGIVPGPPEPMPEPTPEPMPVVVESPPVIDVRPEPKPVVTPRPKPVLPPVPTLPQRPAQIPIGDGAGMFVLTGVVYDADPRLAVLDGRVVQEGDEIDGWKVRSITKDAVDLFMAGEIRRIRMDIQRNSGKNVSSRY